MIFISYKGPVGQGGRTISDLQYLISAESSPGAEQRTISDAFRSIYLSIVSYPSIYVQGAGQMEGRTAPPFISQIYKMFTLTILPERYLSELQESVCIVHTERKYIRREENTACINFISPQHSELKYSIGRFA